MSQTIDTFMQHVKVRNQIETEFHQAVSEVIESIWPLIESESEISQQQNPRANRRAGDA